MRRLLLWTGTVLAVLATLGFVGAATALEVGREQVRLETVAPSAPSAFKVHETITLGRNGFAPPP